MTVGTHEHDDRSPPGDLAARRAVINRRTVAVLAVLALAVYLGFIGLMALGGR